MLSHRRRPPLYTATARRHCTPPLYITALQKRRRKCTATCRNRKHTVNEMCLKQQVSYRPPGQYRCPPAEAFSALPRSEGAVICNPIGKSRFLYIAVSGCRCRPPSCQLALTASAYRSFFFCLIRFYTRHIIMMGFSSFGRKIRRFFISFVVLQKFNPLSINY